MRDLKTISIDPVVLEQLRVLMDKSDAYQLGGDAGKAYEWIGIAKYLIGRVLADAEKPE